VTVQVWGDRHIRGGDIRVGVRTFRDGASSGDRHIRGGRYRGARTFRDGASSGR
jgi:hypothetical protein